MSPTRTAATAGRLTLRSFRATDRAACQAIAARAALSSYGAQMPRLRGRFTADEPLEAADQRILATSAGQVLGFVELVGSHVSNLFVDPPHQQRGVGAALLTEAERRIAGDVTLSVFTVNSRARHLYERLGYTVEGTGLTSFAGAQAEVWRMRKPRGATASPYRLAIFDFDGVLADSAAWMLRTLNPLAREFGFRETSDVEIAALRGASSREILRALQVPLLRLPAIARRLRALSRTDAEEIPLFPGVAELLARLARSGVETAIVSSNGEDTVRAVLGPANAALVDHFACGASLFGKGRRFHEVLRRAGVGPRACLAIGDETRDLDAARQARVLAGAVTWGYASPPALERQAPDYIFDSLEDLAGALAPQAAA